MHIVLAYHNDDAELALLSAQAIEACGWNAGHHAAILCPRGAKDTERIESHLRKSFVSVERVIATDGFFGYPLGPNQMFTDIACAWALQKTGFFFFFEADVTPMMPGWCDALENEITKSRCAFSGVRHDQIGLVNGKTLYRHYTGAGVYSCDIALRSPLVRSLPAYNMDYREKGVVPPPWDVYIANDLFKPGVSYDSKLQASYVGTQGYKQVDGKIKFHAANPKAKAVLDTIRDCYTVDEKAVTVHGCKDGSLQRIVIARYSGKPQEPVTEVKEEAQPKHEQSMPIAAGGHEALIVSALIQSPGMTIPEIGTLIFGKSENDTTNYNLPAGRACARAKKKGLIQDRDVEGNRRWYVKQG